MYFLKVCHQRNSVIRVKLHVLNIIEDMRIRKSGKEKLRTGKIDHES
jgi:hypothetical protein